MNYPPTPPHARHKISLRALAKAVLPVPLRRHVKRLMAWPRVGRVQFGSLRRLTPISDVFGADRGSPIDRYYINGFIARHQDDIRGRVLEIGHDLYTRRYGGNRVTRSDVLHVSADNPAATIVGDLTSAEHIPTDAFDCIIFTQTLQCIYDIRAALRTLHRVLKPGGTLLTTCHGISQLSPFDMERWGEYWRFTTRSAQRFFEEVFPPERIEVRAHGNVLVAVAFLHGLAEAELAEDELDYHDPAYQVVITVKAVKPPVQ